MADPGQANSEPVPPTGDSAGRRTFTCRAFGHPESPSGSLDVRPREVEVTVAAKSALQAVAILRRRGWHVSEEETPRQLGRPDGDERELPIDMITRPRPACVACGYQLEGLILRDGAVVCPECGQATALVAMTAEGVVDGTTAGGLLSSRAGGIALPFGGFSGAAIIAALILAGSFFLSLIARGGAMESAMFVLAAVVAWIAGLALASAAVGRREPPGCALFLLFAMIGLVAVIYVMGG